MSSISDEVDLEPVRAGLEMVGDRVYALSALRAAAISIAVLGHAGIAYMHTGIPGLLWPIHDQSRNFLLDAFCLWAQLAAMPCFFFMAGYFAAGLYDSRGPRRYLRQRILRLLVPLALGCAIVLPITFYVWSYGWLMEGECTLKEILAIKFRPEIQKDLIGPAHLWFLEYLFLISCGYLVARITFLDAAIQPPEEGRVSRFLALSAWRPVLWALPTMGVLLVAPTVFTEFRNSFVPDPGRLAYYTIFFAGGILLYRFRWEHRQLVRYHQYFLGTSILAVGAVAAMLKQVGWANDNAAAHTVLFAAFAALASWLSVFGLLGLALSRFRARSAIVRYASDASIWVYLFHLPIVGIGQIGLATWEIPAVVKFGLVSAVALSASLATYQLFVRHTFLGRILHGVREPMRGYALAPVPH